MLIKDIHNFSQIRYNARAYLAYLFERNIPNKLPGVSLDAIKAGFDKIAHEIESFDAFYILGANGVQIGNNLSLDKAKITGDGANRANKAYYYRAVRERRCVLSDPYPSSLTNELCVTASEPVYDEKDELKFVVCIDISLKDILKMIAPSAAAHAFENFAKTIYALFALGLFAVVSVLFYLGIKSLVLKSLSEIDISEMFESTIILTLALAIFDLVRAIIDEEVLCHKQKHQSGVSRTMVRFLGSIIIALAIEALMLVFKFAITNPNDILYAVYLVGGVAVLISSLGFYLFASNKKS